MRGLRWAIAVLLLLGVAAGVTFYRAPLWVNDLRLRAHLRQAHVRSQTVDVDGYTIHYFEALPPTRAGAPDRPLVLIHGLGARGEDWSAMIPGLAARGFHVYAPDLLGYGRSAHPDVDYSIALEEQTVAHFMDAVGVRRADVAGWSMGGWIAMKLAEDQPGRVARLVLYDSAGIYFPAAFDASLFTPTDGAGLWHLQQMLTPSAKPLPKFVADDAIQKLHANAWVIGRSVQSMKNGKDLLDFHLQSIHQPTLIVWGRQDRLIPVSVGEALHRDIAGSSLLLVDGCGHLAPTECWQPVLRGSLRFLLAEPPMVGGESTVPGH